MNKNILIIGSAGYMLDHKIGDKIDSFNGEIARFNHYLIKGFEECVGSKTNWWFTDRGAYKQRKHNVKNIIFVGYNKSINETKYINLFNNDKNIKAGWIGGDVVEETQKAIKFKGPTSGVLAITFFLKKGYNVFIHGFDFFQDYKRIHYYETFTDSQAKKIMNIIKRYHSGKHEKKWVNDLILGNRVQWFYERGGEN